MVKSLKYSQILKETAIKSQQSKSSNMELSQSGKTIKTKKEVNGDLRWEFLVKEKNSKKFGKRSFLISLLETSAHISKILRVPVSYKKEKAIKFQISD